MSNFFYAEKLEKPEDVKSHLAKEYHWKEKYSAYELAHSWIGSGGFPASVRTILAKDPKYQSAEIVEAFFERDVDLRTAGRNSQADILVFAALAQGYAAIAVEGKVEETFGSLVAEWNDGSPGKGARLSALCKLLNLASDVGHLRYQLFHRTACAVFEAQRYRCRNALVLVHSFSATQSHFADFVEFTKAVGAPVTSQGEMSKEVTFDGVYTQFAWCADAIAA